MVERVGGSVGGDGEGSMVVMVGGGGGSCWG